MAVTDLNKVIYVDAEFNTAVDKIQDFLSTEYPDEFNDYVNANMGQALIDIIGYAEQNLMWYLNRKVTDLYFPSAVTPNAVSKLARTLAYKPKSATYSEVPITMTLKKGPYNFPVVINKGQQFRGPNNTIWEYRGDVAVVYQPGDTVKTFTVGQGQTLTSTFLSNNENNQIFELRAVPVTKFVAGKGFQVLVDGVEWTEYPVIPFQNIQAFETNLLSSPPYVKFGDSVQGSIPPLGTSIQVQYVVTDGFKGRILSNGIKEPVGNIVANFQNIPVSIAQPDVSVGGDDPEDLRSITTNAPLFQRTQDRAITKGDYDFLANQYTNVAKADAQIIRGVSGDATVQSLFVLFRQDLAKLKASSCVLGPSGAPTGTVSGTANAVSGYLDVLYDHIDSAFSDGCRGNLVQVSVLAKDANRKYVSPLQATLDGLKAYLDARKDVVHTLSVVGGTARVVNANIRIEVKVSQTAVEDDVVKAIGDSLAKSDATPFGILVERAFNKSLYIWEIQDAIKAAVVPESQIIYANIAITGPTEFLDARGNLVVPDGYVIQAGTITIVKLPRF